MPGIHLSPTQMLFPTHGWPRNILKVECIREMDEMEGEDVDLAR